MTRLSFPPARRGRDNLRWWLSATLGIFIMATLLFLAASMGR